MIFKIFPKIKKNSPHFCCFEFSMMNLEWFFFYLTWLFLKRLSIPCLLSILRNYIISLIISSPLVSLFLFLESICWMMDPLHRSSTFLTFYLIFSVSLLCVCVCVTFWDLVIPSSSSVSVGFLYTIIFVNFQIFFLRVFCSGFMHISLNVARNTNSRIFVLLF